MPHIRNMPQTGKYLPRQPNARPELLPEAGAQRTLEAVSSRPLFGKAPASLEPDPGVPRVSIGSPHLPGAAGMGTL